MQPRSNKSIFVNSLVRTIGYNEELADNLIKKYIIGVTDDWIPTSNLIDCLFHIEEKIGSYTLKRIGSNIAQEANMSVRKHGSFESFLLKQLNEIYQLNHQRLNKGFHISFINEDYILNLNNNPYPLTFNIGLLSGFSFRHHALNEIEQIDKDTIMIKKII